MRFFNYEEIYLKAHGDPSLMLRYFEESPSSGADFIVRPRAIVEAKFLPDIFKAEYLGLCSLRNYSDYSDHGIVDLDRERIPPWVPLIAIEENPLVILTDHKIIFNKEK